MTSVLITSSTFIVSAPTQSRAFDLILDITNHRSRNRQAATWYAAIVTRGRVLRNRVSTRFVTSNYRTSVADNLQVHIRAHPDGIPAWEGNALGKCPAFTGLRKKEGIMFETIVWATDGSELADSVLPLVTDLAGVHGSKIVTVHVDERYRGGRSTGAPVLADEGELRAKIAEQVADLTHAGFTAVFEVETTQRHDTAESIVEVATKNQADLIVIGTHGRGALASAVVGSVANRLLHVAHCPVLAVLPPRDTESSVERPELASARA
jgi:nucleotide-binding universal stress UspA family protein